MDKLLHAFVDFYRWNSENWLECFKCKEAGHQLLLLAFLQRIGWEVQESEGRQITLVWMRRY